MTIVTEPTQVGFYAYDESTYCGCDECGCLIGGGLTEQAAIDDLLEQMDEVTHEHG